MPDALELESLGKLLEERHGVFLSAMWHDGLTLGELFERARAA